MPAAPFSLGGENNQVTPLPQSRPRANPYANGWTPYADWDRQQTDAWNVNNPEQQRAPNSTSPLTQYDPWLQSVGWTGPKTIEQGSGDMITQVTNPELTSWLGQQGYTFGRQQTGSQGGSPFTSGATYVDQAFDSSGNPVGPAYGSGDNNASALQGMALVAAGALGSWGAGAAGTAGGGAAGTGAAGTGATNAALAESAVGTAGYGASSAGAGGGAGLAAGTGGAGVATGTGTTAAAGGAGTAAGGAAAGAAPFSLGGYGPVLASAALQQLNRPPDAPDANQLIASQSAANTQAAELGASINRPDIHTPLGSQTWSRVPDPSQPGGFRYVQTNTLSPEQQRLYEGSTTLQQGAQGIAGQLQGQLGQQLGTPFSLGGPDLVTSVGDGSMAPRDYSRERDQTIQSVLDRGRRILDPQQEEATQAFDSQLRNQGLMPGTEAYDRGLRQLRQSQDQTNLDLQDRAVAAGSQEQGRLADLDLRTIQQALSQRLSAAGFTNNARQQSISEQTLQRNQPLAEYNALMSGAQPTMPTFQPFSTQGVAPTNTQAAYGAQQQGQQANYNAQQGNLQSLLNLGTSIYNSNQPQWDPNTGTWVSRP